MNTETKKTKAHVTTTDTQTLAASIADMDATLVSARDRVAAIAAELDAASQVVDAVIDSDRSRANAAHAAKIAEADRLVSEARDRVEIAQARASETASSFAFASSPEGIVSAGDGAQGNIETTRFECAKARLELDAAHLAEGDAIANLELHRGSRPLEVTVDAALLYEWDNARRAVATALDTLKRSTIEGIAATRAMMAKEAAERQALVDEAARATEEKSRAQADYQLRYAAQQQAAARLDRLFGELKEVREHGSDYAKTQRGQHRTSQLKSEIQEQLEKVAPWVRDEYSARAAALGAEHAPATKGASFTFARGAA